MATNVKVKMVPETAPEAQWSYRTEKYPNKGLVEIPGGKTRSINYQLRNSPSKAQWSKIEVESEDGSQSKTWTQDNVGATEPIQKGSVQYGLIELAGWDATDNTIALTLTNDGGLPEVIGISVRLWVDDDGTTYGPSPDPQIILEKKDG